MSLYFDASTIVPNMGGYDPLPAGDYKVVLAKDQERQNRNGTGSHTEFFFDVVEGSFKGRQVIDRINLGNNDPNTKARAQARLSALCHAVGKLQIRSLRDLYNLTLVVTVNQREIRDPNPDPSSPRLPRIVNEVSNYKRIDPSQSVNPTQTPALGNTSNSNSPGSTNNPRGTSNPKSIPWGP